MNNSTITNNKSSLTKQNMFLRRSFAIAAIAFICVCIIGFAASQIVDSSGILKNALDSTGRFNWSIYSSKLSGSSPFFKLSILSFSAIALIVISSILNMIWMFRIHRASRTFIYTVYSIYVLAQGLGFGMLFLTWKATELLAVFGIAGGIFAIVATIGYFAKDLMPLGKLLFVGSFFAIGLGLVAMVMWLVGVYSDTVSMLFWTLTGILTIGWIAFDVWWIKKSSYYVQMYQDTDPDMYFRLVAFASFKLLSDLISLIWVVARFYFRYKK